MNPGALPAGFYPASFCPVDDVPDVTSDYHDARRAVADNLVSAGESNLRAVLDLTLGRIEALEKVAAVALDAFNNFFAANRGGAKTAVEWLVDSAKNNLVAGCWDIAEEYLAPGQMTGSVETTAPFAKFVRSIFEYATGESVDDPGNSLDRSIRAIGGERSADRSPSLDALNAQLRQGHMKPS
jgi:hypothetical protein